MLYTYIVYDPDRNPILVDVIEGSSEASAWKAVTKMAAACKKKVGGYELWIGGRKVLAFHSRPPPDGPVLPKAS